MALSIAVMRVRTLSLALAVGIAALAGAYAIYWYAAAESLRDGFVHFVDERRAEGYRIELGALALAGFPASIGLRLGPSVIEAPKGSWRWAVPTVLLRTRPWRARGLDIELPGRHGILIAGKETLMEAGAARLTLASPAHSVSGVPSEAVRFVLRATEIVVIDGPEPALGRAIAETAVDGSLLGPVQGGTEWLAAWRDAGGTLDIERLRLVWGPLTSDGDGTFALDETMRPIGAMSVRLGGYNEAIDRLVEAGLMSAREGLGHKVALAAFAHAEPDGSVSAQVPLTLQDGFAYVGPIAISGLPALE